MNPLFEVPERARSAEELWELRQKKLHKHMNKIASRDITEQETDSYYH